MRKPVWIGILFVVGVLAAIIWSTMNMSQVTVKVCMAYEGRTNCAQASGSTREFALRTATTTACASIAGGVTGTIACEGSRPLSVENVR
jgi:hypothetical protein